MRLFVAIDVPSEWKRLLGEVQSSIGWLGKGVKWVSAETMHLTLKFIGETDESVLPALTRTLNECGHRFDPFVMQLRGTGVFPNRNKPRVFWAGLKTDGTLMDLQQSIDDKTAELGFESDANPFKPHLTLARIKEPIGKERITDAFLNYKIESEPITVNRVALVRSFLQPDGARYEEVGEFHLGKTELAAPAGSASLN